MLAIPHTSPWRLIGPLTTEPSGPLHLARQDAGAPFITLCERRVPVSAARLYTLAPDEALCPTCRGAGLPTVLFTIADYHSGISTTTTHKE
jgi:hypothetical protein